MAKHTVVAIPAKNEGERIGSCLSALDRQTHHPDAVVLMINNSGNATQTIARDMAPGLAFHLAIMCQDLPPAQANAGYARRRAIEVAATLAGPDGILLTTDADAVTPPDWVFRNVLAVRQGADIVCGRAVIDLRLIVFSEVLYFLSAADIACCARRVCDTLLPGGLIVLVNWLGKTDDPSSADAAPSHFIAATSATLRIVLQERQEHYRLDILASA